MNMVGNTFENNKAENNSNLTVSGLGGAIYYTCTTNYDCDVAITDDNIFKDNSAENAGGAIKWDDLEP